MVPRFGVVLAPPYALCAGAGAVGAAVGVLVVVDCDEGVLMDVYLLTYDDGACVVEGEVPKPTFLSIGAAGVVAVVGLDAAAGVVAACSSSSHSSSS